MSIDNDTKQAYCDRCGARIYPKLECDGIAGIYAVAVCSGKLKYTHDLCPDCYSELVEFMNMKKVETSEQ